MAIQKTFSIIKPEAIADKLIGKIVTRIEDSGLKITKMQMMSVPRSLAEKHYEKDDAWAAMVGGFTLKDYAGQGLDPVQEVGTDDPVKIGRLVQERTIAHLTSAPVIAMELTGEDAVASFRALCGATNPSKADPESIRGTYSKDDSLKATMEKRPLLNLLHSSGNVEEAEHELEMWFGK